MLGISVTYYAGSSPCHWSVMTAFCCEAEWLAFRLGLMPCCGKRENGLRSWMKVRMGSRVPGRWPVLWAGAIVLAGLWLAGVPSAGAQRPAANTKDASAIDASAIDASTTDLDAQRLPLTSLTGPWRFHPGDNAAWSQPGFDDSEWKTVSPTRDWMEQGFTEQGQMAWFRFRLRVKPGAKTVTLVMPNVMRAYQIFANGTMVGQWGSLPPENPRQVVQTPRLFTIPVPQAGAKGDEAGQVVLVAMRLWEDPQMVGVNANVLRGLPYAGAAAITERMFTLRYEEFLLSLGTEYTQDVVGLVVGAACLLLWLLTRESSYAWFALNLLISCLNLLARILGLHYEWPIFSSIFFYMAAGAAGQITWVLFITGALGVRGRWKVGIPIALAVLTELGPLLVLLAKTPLVWGDGMFFVINSFAQLWLLVYLLQGWRRKVDYARLLAFPYGLAAIASTLDGLGHFLMNLGVPHAEQIIPSYLVLTTSPFGITVNDAVDLLATLGVLVVLVYRFARTSREQQRLAAALAAAHEVQGRLVPVDVASLGGLRTEIVSLAAEEVGGDFCQVLQRPNGSILVAIGDVSGKGLQAAMTGALAVGALRSLADDAIEPAEALARLNEVLLRTENKGFITCLCMELTAEGQLTVANAGHLAPYLNGVEVELAGGLPLGLVRGVVYEQKTFRLPAKARLTLLSDGVVEARSQAGELFGFDRTQGVSERPAAQIAEEARRHGQEDDITVITLDWAQPAFAM